MNNEKSTLTYGIVGVGLMGKEHIRNLLRIPSAQITCVADDYQESIVTCRGLLEIEAPDQVAHIQFFGNSRDLFAANLCNVAVIATPNHTHHRVLKEAYDIANPDMHILVEKPLCTTIEHCREVIDAANGRSGRTYVGLEYCYMPPIARIIADSKMGVIGIPKMVAIREHRFPFLKKVRNWNRFSRNTGGTFVEKCCHFFDLFNRILHPAVPLSVFASGAQDVNHQDEVYDGEKSDIVDNGFVIVQYSGSTRACLDLCMFAEASRSQEEISITGSEGKLEAFLPQLEVRKGLRGRHSCGNVSVEVVNDERIQYQGHHHGSSYLEHLDIMKALKSTKREGHGNISTAGLLQGLVSVAMGVAAHISAEENRVVRMSELLTDKELKCVPVLEI
ncbi:unnamed protein product [Agarophyton chilense]|eukprot:gb/GEZJ01004411.1/.p1 GENE.gb/GEZJ01004411.1/~~gb/GEZJ01004411.1/.p1  ORF type:complete len:390 (-),score=51.85 gb/GEZJ01004411.1/:701-1870(-)